MQIDHLGVVVRNIEKGIKQWTDVFDYHQVTEVVKNTRQKVYVVFLEQDNNTTIKLIAPVDDTSPIAVFAKKGGGLHHICFKCEDLDEGVAIMKKKGCRQLVEPQPGEAFGGNRIAFLFAQNGLNIELIDTDVKAMRID